MNQSAHAILLVEDSPEDAEAVLRAFRKSGLINPIHHCADGDEALDYLHRRGRYAQLDAAPRPSVILLDLNMPGTDGREVLAEIKQNEALKQIPVVVLTTSSDERDIEKCYAMGANSFIKKPVDLGGFMRAIQLLKDYWLQIVILPKANDAK
ncbi:MAG TPA: response regulator [Methylocystis sp.]|nr:response regulator [Methylocystis sp.]